MPKTALLKTLASKRPPRCMGRPGLRMSYLMSYHNSWSLQHLSEAFVKSKHFVDQPLVIDPYAGSQGHGLVAKRTRLLTSMCFFRHTAHGRITACWRTWAFGKGTDHGANKSFLSTGYGLAGPVLGVELHLGTGIAWVNDALGKCARFRGSSLRIWRRSGFSLTTI